MSPDSGGIEHFNFKPIGRSLSPGFGWTRRHLGATDDLHVFTGLACIGEEVAPNV
eukprot:CAMPEP_0183548760 /NCGR_PEP_ID=MMETSP0371-20130417/60985_1 /TAXON_ID=268820 /ORGANISM="Peridinium aciculiferum, Strain PAER-2" /LENGTH=54 /DNA_ID=CAMNT_0025752253 /DNA_START=17 /DNA_END=177 /DNA_ORIENTATION=-